jgi:uncharacterized protein (DUF2236 family)
VSWRIDREVFVLAGGSCALLMQAAHPAVAAGVAQHSSYRTDPYGRLSRTLRSSLAVAFGTRRQAAAAIRHINAIHAKVRGTIPETGEPYRALDPAALLWVHATLVDTAVRVYDRFVAHLTAEDAEAYHRECAPVAWQLGIPRAALPPTLAELRAWMDEMVASGAVRVTPTARDIARTILRPGRFPPGIVWDAAHLASLATLRPDLREQYGLAWDPRRERAAALLAGGTRRLLPLVPPPLRYVPHARRAVARVHHVAAGAGGAD